MRLEDEVYISWVKNDWAQKRLEARLQAAQLTAYGMDKGDNQIDIAIRYKFSKAFVKPEEYLLSEKNDSRYQLLFNIIKNIIDDVNSTEDITPEIMRIIESSIKETVKRIKRR